MKSKIELKYLLFIVSIIGIVFSTIIIFPFISSLFNQDSYAKQISIINNQTTQNSINGEQTSLPVIQTDFGLPVRLKIPSIKVEANVEYVGLTSDGAMDVPKGPSDVAWFDIGPHPGEKGSAVMAGHFGWKNNIPAVFDDLYKLRKGDKLYVEDEKGVIISFVVRESRTFDPKADTSDVFGSNDGKAHLNLVTCEGIWNDVKKGRPFRLVVFTDKE